MTWLHPTDHRSKTRQFWSGSGWKVNRQVALAKTLGRARSSSISPRTANPPQAAQHAGATRQPAATPPSAAAPPPSREPVQTAPAPTATAPSLAAAETTPRPSATEVSLDAAPPPAAESCSAEPAAWLPRCPRSATNMTQEDLA